ncbi:MAG: hypothetical protein JW954_07370 [Dehalococcoidaceae bacterium]|nr:hypothetical protein [Dehalococcoidaceae bacterium]
MMFLAVKKYLPAAAGILLVLSVTLAACAPQPAATPFQTTPNQTAEPQTTAVQTNPAGTSQVTTSQTSVPHDTSQGAITTSPATDYTPKPAPGFEFRVPLEYDKWTVLDFEYDIVHQPGEDYHFPWTLVIQNDTTAALPLRAYIIHWGFHGWVGFVTETPFILEAGETRTLSGEDVFGQSAYEEMLYLESTHLDIYIAGR